MAEVTVHSSLVTLQMNLKVKLWAALYATKLWTRMAWLASWWAWTMAEASIGIAGYVGGCARMRKEAPQVAV